MVEEEEEEEEVVVVVGGRLGETTVAGERERRDREGGSTGEAADIHEDAKCFFSRRGDTLLVCRETEGRAGKERRRGRRRVKARRGPAHLSIDLEAIKVSVFLFLHAAASLCVCVCVCVCVYTCVSV